VKEKQKLAGKLGRMKGAMHERMGKLYCKVRIEFPDFQIFPYNDLLRYINPDCDNGNGNN
jgi:hypothetical protein